MDHLGPKGRIILALLCFHILLFSKDLARTHSHGLLGKQTYRLYYWLIWHCQPSQGLYRNVGGIEGISQAQGWDKAIQRVHEASLGESR